MDGAGQLVSTLGQLVGEEYRLLSSVGGQVAELRDELATMNAILRLQSEADEGTADHFIREWMKQVRDLACDAEDCVDLYIIRIRCGLRDLGFVVWSKRLLTTLFSRHRLAGQIQALRARAVAISERHVRYGASREALSSRSSSTPLAPALALPPVPVASVRNLDSTCHEFLGDQADVFAREVMARDPSKDERELKVFSILGFGGIGKTRLAKEVCRLLKAEFHVQAHVSVSQAFDATKDLQTLLKELVQQVVNVDGNFEQGTEEEHSISLAEMDRMSVNDLAWRLNVILKDKRYLIIIDDLWTITAWAAIQSELPENNCGSRVLVTTRIETVAKECSHGSVSRNYIFNMAPLSVDDSKKLFLTGVFGSKDAACPKELEEEMDGILRKCGGLPLAIVSIARLLAGYTTSGSKDMWVKICESIGSQMESTPTLDGMRKIITLSYNYLPYYLRACMIYFSFFPEDYIISKVRILWRWITEGLVEEKIGFTLLEVAEQYFEELVSRSMINFAGDVSMSHGNKGTYRIHDMVLEIMVSKSLEANFISIVGSQHAGKSYHRVRRLSIHDGGQGSGDYRSGIEGMNLNYVRSLSMFDVERNKLLDRLGEFTLLRVLDLEDCKGLENKHMRAICRMYLLRFLGLKGTDISVMPRDVGDLVHLQILDVYQTLLSELPKTVTKLKKVERLLVSNKVTGTMWKAPRGLSEMTALTELSDVVIDNVQVAEEIGDINNLQVIDVYVDGRSHRKEEVRKALACSLGKAYSLHSLNVGDITDDDTALDYLMDLHSPPLLLRYLRMSGKIAGLPDWIGSLEYLVEFAISRTKLSEDKLLGVLCKAPNLQSVLFENNFYTGHQLVARTAHKFPQLKAMRVPSCDECPKVFQFEEGSMTTLETLEVNFGGNTEKSIRGIEHLTNLKMVQLSGERGNPALDDALKQIKEESGRRPKYNRFTIRVQYS